MSLASELAALSGVPGLSTAVHLLTLTYQRAESIKVHRNKCINLSNRCVALLLALDQGSRLEGTEAKETVDEIEYTMTRVLKKITEWSSLSSLKSFLQQGEIELAITRLEGDLATSAHKFDISMKLQSAQRQETLMAIRDRDHAEVREALQVITRNIDELLGMKSNEAVEEVMQGLQEELHDPGLQPVQEESFRAALWTLYDTTDIMPPLADLTGQITQISDRPIFLGTSHDVYRGKWLNKEDVALRLPRSLGHTHAIHKKFQKEVDLWKELKHEHVNPLYGLVYIGEDVFSVSPWMDNGTSISYVQQLLPDTADRLKIINGVALGLEYLHLRNIVHGDLRGSNILISQDGVPRLTDFGLSKLLEEVGQGMTSSASTNPRWSAPELMQQTDPVSTFSDVWSFGMTILELMSGEQPFSNMHRDLHVMRELDQGKTPDRPQLASITDQLWSLLQRCWQAQPKSRPSMTINIKAIAQLQSTRQPHGSPTLFTLPLSASPKQEKSVLPLSRFRNRSSTSQASSDSTSSTSPGRLRSMFSKLKAPTRTTDSQLIPSPTAGDISPISLGSNIRTFTDNGKASTSVSKSVPQTFGSHIRKESSPAAEAYAPSISDQNLFVSSISMTSIDTPASILHISSKGLVVSGTLEGLVGRLLTSTNLEKDIEYRDAFLMTCTDFTSHNDLLSVLARRFREDNVNPQVRAETRLNVMTVIREWVSFPYIRTDPPVESRIKQLCSSIVSDSSTSSAIKAKAKEILHILQSKTSDESDKSSSLLLSPGRRLKASEILPCDLAIALSILEGQLYGRLQPADYIAHLRPDSGGPSLLTVMSNYNSKISAWTKKSVLLLDSLERRGDALTFFVNTAQECLRLRNFSSMVAIVTALKSDPIRRLVLTMRQLSANTTASLKRLNDLLDESGSYIAYKDVLNELSGSEPAVPWVTVHLLDMTSVLKRYPPTIESPNDGQDLIHFTRYSKLALRLKYILQFKPPDLEQYRTQGKLTYLENELQLIIVDEIWEDRISKRSFELHADEKRRFDNRERELRSTGFR